LQQVGGFIRVLQYTNKTDRHDITEILLKVALNTITPTPNPYINFSKLSPLILYFLSAINVMKKTNSLHSSACYKKYPPYIVKSLGRGFLSLTLLSLNKHFKFSLLNKTYVRMCLI
jgi:hypothetical protein